MEIECMFFGPIREVAETKETTQTLAEGATVMDLIETLATDYEALDDLLLTEEGNLHESLNITVNKRNVRQLDSESTVLSERDTVHISPSIQGG